jgi:hypothetical protein
MNVTINAKQEEEEEQELVNIVFESFEAVVEGRWMMMFLANFNRCSNHAHSSLINHFFKSHYHFLPFFTEEQRHISKHTRENELKRGSKSSSRPSPF